MAGTAGPWSRQDVGRMLDSVGEILEDGVSIGYVDAALRFKVNEAHLGHGGFLEVRRASLAAE